MSHSLIVHHASDLREQLCKEVLNDDLSILDLLDALTACGLTLAEDLQGEAPRGFFEVLKKPDPS